MCRQNCEFCEATIEADDVATVKRRGRNHLRSDHYEEFAEVFTDEYAGKDCRIGCGYTFPTGVEEVAGFDCPSCGHDYFDSFVERYLYWQIELE